MRSHFCFLTISGGSACNGCSHVDDDPDSCPLRLGCPRTQGLGFPYRSSKMGSSCPATSDVYTTRAGQLGKCRLVALKVAQAPCFFYPGKSTPGCPFPSTREMHSQTSNRIFELHDSVSERQALRQVEMMSSGAGLLDKCRAPIGLKPMNTSPISRQVPHSLQALQVVGIRHGSCRREGVGAAALYH